MNNYTFYFAFGRMFLSIRIIEGCGMKKGLIKNSLVVMLCLSAFCIENNAFALDIPLKATYPASSNTGSRTNYSSNNNYSKYTSDKTSNIQINNVNNTVNNGDNYLEEVYQKYKQIVYWQKNYLLVYIPNDARADFIWSQFKIWENVLGGTIAFEKIPVEKNADILVHYENAYLGKEVGFTRLSFKEGTIRRADMFIYDDILTNPLKDYCVLHEIGHALGITNHSSNPGDIMYPTKTARQNGLSMRDKNTIKMIYDLSGQTPSFATAPPDYSLRSEELQNADKLFENGQFENAIQLYKKAAALPQYEAEAYGGVASCYFAMGNGEQSWKYAKKAVNLQENNRDLVYIFMRIGLATNHSKEVKKFLDKYIVEYPDALADNQIQSTMILLQQNTEIKTKNKEK